MIITIANPRVITLPKRALWVVYLILDKPPTYFLLFLLTIRQFIFLLKKFNNNMSRNNDDL